MSASPARIGATSRATSRPVVLVVGVGVDDHVGAELERRVEPGLEARGEALVVGQAHDVVDAVCARDLDRAVGRAVVDDQPLDRLEAVDLAREVGQRDRERLLLVQARDLDDQLHARARTVPLRHRRAMTTYRPATVTLVILSSPMEGLTVTRRPAPRAPRSLDADTIARARVRAALPGASRSGSSSIPTYPNYDSYYSLLWGREVLDLDAPTSRASASRPSTRWRSPPARCCRCSARPATGCGSP